MLAMPEIEDVSIVHNGSAMYTNSGQALPNHSLMVTYDGGFTFTNRPPNDPTELQAQAKIEPSPCLIEKSNERLLRKIDNDN